MKYLWGALLYFLLCFTLLAAEEVEEEVSPSSHAILAYRYLKKKPPQEAKYLRFLSYYNYKNAEKRIKSMRFWINQLHLEPAVSFAEVVPDTNGLLTVIDIREFGWSKEAFSAVARREPYFKSVAVDAATAVLLREIIGIEQDPNTLHAEAIVRADWFFRETFESDRSPSYYDLLFARQRFKVERYNKDGYTYAKPAEFIKFPKNEADFERIFAVDKFREHFKEFRIDTRHGAVVEGMEKGVSIVARQNRLIERIMTPIGVYYKTFDVKETSGKRDFAETLNKDFVFDAGEIVTDTPCGGMACLLVNAQGDIVERADNRFATDTSDLKFDATVRTPGSCFICHEQKYIMPKNLVKEMISSGIDIKFKKKKDKVDAKGFFLDWEDKLESEQTRFTKFIARTSGFKAGENATLLKQWRDEYDTAVTLQVAAVESGLTVQQFKLLGEKSIKARILMLVKGLTIPRKTWENDSYKDMQLLRDASRK